MRAKAAHITATTIGDDNFVNSYNAGLGLTPDAEIGKLIRIIAGTGKGQTPAVIKSNTNKIFTIMKEWEVTPDSTSVWIVEAATWQYKRFTDTLHNDGTAAASFVVGQIPLVNFNDGSLLVMGLTLDSDERPSFEAYAPIREVYVNATPIRLGVTKRGVAVTY
jgi:hypothetical protein